MSYEPLEDLRNATTRLVLEIGGERKRAYIIEIPGWELVLDDVINDLVRPLLFAAGFAEQAVNEYISPS